MISLAALAIPLVLAACGSKSTATSDAGTSKTSSAAPAAATTEASAQANEFKCKASAQFSVNAATETDASGVYPIKPKAAPANAKLLKSDLRYGHYTYLIINTSPDAAADFVRKAVGDLFSVVA